jgi:hypothetical protein
MPKDKRNELLLQCWTVAYEKAILDKAGGEAKDVIDQACCQAVDNLTKILSDEGYDIPKEDLEESTSRRFETMKASIEHHIENLKKGRIFPSAQEFKIQPLTDYEYTEEVLEIIVENCTYKEACEWAVDEDIFRENGKYRCQRLGCFVGAVKKYMDENLPADKRRRLKYHIKTVMQPTETEDEQKAGEKKYRCQGFVFVDNFVLDILLETHPTKVPPKVDAPSLHTLKTGHYV